MTEIEVEARTFRRVDTASKLLGLALIVFGLEAGPVTPLGAGLVALGIACGTITVFITNNE